MRNRVYRCSIALSVNGGPTSDTAVTMASKGKAFTDEPTGVACTAYRNFKVKIGAGSDGVKLPKPFLVPIRNDESREDAVRRHHDKIRDQLASLSKGRASLIIAHTPLMILGTPC